MKVLQKKFFVFIVLSFSFFLTSTVFSRDLPRRVKVRSPHHSSIDLITNKVFPKPDDAEILNDYDRLEVQLVPDATDKLSIKYQPIVPDPNPDPNDPEPSTKLIPIKPDDALYVWSEITVFDKWGDPGTDLAEYNGYIKESEDLGFNVEHNDFMGSMKPPPPAAFFRLQLINDPADVDHPFNPDENPADLDLADHAIVQRRLLFALKSECNIDNSEKSVFCNYHETLNPYIFIITGPATGSTMQAVHYDQDPNKGAQAVSSTPILKGELEKFVKEKNGVLQVIFKNP